MPYLLVRGHSSFRVGSVDTAFAGDEFLYPGQSISVKIGKPEHWYYMLALGSASKRPGDIFFTDYRLELRDSERPDSGQVFLKFDRLALFLSSVASGPDLVKAVASFDVLDC